MSEQRPASDPAPKKTRAGLFWIALLAPAVLSLASFLIGAASNDAGAMVGLVALFTTCISAGFCSLWLARRFVKPGGGRMLFGFVMAIVIVAVNFIIVVAGCANNLSFH
jgi:hypothetical protein